ncbi:MAG: hypothetical protein RIC55_07215 [Pirellulaceae bacterium]
MKNRSEKSCGPQPLADELPADVWTLDRLGEFAAIEHRAIVHDEITLAPRYWRLGLALHLARKLIRHGMWQHFLRAHGIDKTRASKARAIYGAFESADELDGLTVEEAYSRRRRPRNRHAKEGLELDSLQKLSAFLRNLCDVIETAEAEAQLASPESAAELLNILPQAFLALEQIRIAVEACAVGVE